MTRNVFTGLIACLVWVWFPATQGHAFEAGLTESEGAIRTWRTADGLPADAVTAIIQTRDGFLWVGTSAGLVRFDGVKFTTNSSVSVTALCEDSRGHLWIGTQQDGAFELARGKLTQYTKANGLLDDSVTSLAADDQGFVWIGSKTGVNLFTGSYFKPFTVRDGLPDELVSGVHVARSGAVWITTRNGMCRFVNGRIAPYPFPTDSQGRSPEYIGAYEDRRGDLWAFGDTYLINLAEGKRFNYFRGNEAASVRIWSLCEGRDGRLWIGTSGRGLFCFGDNRFQPVPLGELRWPYDVRAICEDREGNLWLGTSGGGLVQLHPQPVHVLSTEQGLPASVLPTALALDPKGRVLVGLQQGGIYVGESGRFERFPSGNGAGLEVRDFVSSLCAGPDSVWAGTLGGGLYGLRDGRAAQFTTANGLGDDMVLASCMDAEGNVWASTSAGTVHRISATNATRFDTVDGLPGVLVTVLIPAPGGGVWLGTDDGTILRSQQGKIELVSPGEKLGSRPVLALYSSEPDRLWIGTAGRGLACLTKDAISMWDTSRGLPSGVVAGVVEDTAKNLWLATGAGIYRVDRNAVQAALADPEADLGCTLMSEARTSYESATIFGGTRALRASDGRMWFATSEGVLSVDARQSEVQSLATPVYIEAVAFNGQPPLPLVRNVAWSEIGTKRAPFTVRGPARVVDIQFTAVNFSAPEKIRFRHRLDGVDLDWVDDGTSRSARYGPLPYGQYEFRLAARIAEGPWQDAIAPFAFEVPTPLYFRAWAIALYVFVAVALVAGIVRMVSHRRLRHALAQLEQQQTVERERMRIARDMHDEIGSKLTKISFLSEHVKMDAEKSGPLAGKIASIAETSRELLQTMDEIVWVVNPRNDTLEQLAAYLSHYAVEYFQKTDVECDMRLPRQIPHHPLSSEARHNLFLTFEEALNNVLKHSGATKVKVEMNVTAEEFEVSITDNGRGFEVAKLPETNGSPANARIGNGLKNMHQRLEDIGGACFIRSEPGAGTTVSMRINLKRNSTGKP